MKIQARSLFFERLALSFYKCCGLTDLRHCSSQVVEHDSIFVSDDIFSLNLAWGINGVGIN